MDWQNAMKGYAEKIVNLMKSHNLFESQGGPIILSQVVYLSGFFIPISSLYNSCVCWSQIPLKLVQFSCKLSVWSATADWEWVWATSQGTWSTGTSVRNMGCKYGSWIGHRRPMGDVQGRRCTRSCGKQT